MLQHGLRTINRHFAFVAICIVMAARFSFGEVAEGQTPTKNGDAGALAAYDVVSIKPVNPEVTVGGLQYTPDGIRAAHSTVSALVRMAYGGFLKLPTEDCVIGLPGWAKTEYFAVETKMNAEQTAEFAKLSYDEQEARREAMVQALLEDRFKFKGAW